MKRKMLAAREDLVNRISNVANRRGFTLFDMLNDLLELAVKVDGMGLSLRDVVGEYGLVKAAKDAGFVLGLESLWYEMAELAYNKAKGKALKSWFEAGVWLAKRYATSDTADPLEAFKKDLKAFTWNAPEFTIEKAENKISIRLISPRFPESYTLLFTSFLEGALETFNYEIVEKEVSKGNIRLEAVWKGADVQE
ncbi:MAG: hypothetical protein QXY74_08175 [Candidatus Bathyarchaeia archaeon]